MNYCFLFVVSFLACFSTVYGVGEVVLDQIVPNGDLVSFQDPLYTDYGSIETITTDTFGVTRQFELNVHTPDVVLNGLEGGVDFYGTLGTTVSSTRGDLSFLASNNTSVSGSEITAIARELLEIGSQAGDVIFNVETGTLELVAGTSTLSAENILDVTTLGAMSFSSGETLSLQSDISISITAVEDLTFEARSGNVLFAAGNELVLSSASTIALDGTNSVSIDTAGSLDLIAGNKVQFTGITSDFLVKDNSTISYNIIDIFADDGVVVGGRAVRLNAANRVVVNTDSPGADISVDFGSLLTISAESDISLHATGETGNVILHATSFAAAFTEDFSASSTILNFGGASTNSIRLASTEYTFTSNNIGISAVESISIASKTSTSFSSNDHIINTPLWTLTAATSTVNISAKDFNLFSGINQLPVTFSSAASTTITANTVYLGAGEIAIKSIGNSLFNVDDLTVTSSVDNSVEILGANIITNIGDDMTLNTGEFISDSNQFSLFLENDFALESNSFFMEFDNMSFDVLATVDSSFELNSSRHLFIEGDQFLLDVGTELSIDVNGGMYFDSNEDIFFITSGELSFDASKTIHLDVFESSFISGGDLTIDGGDNIYLKTSILSLEGLDDLGVTANSISASFGDLSFEAGTEIEFSSGDNLTVNSGGDVNLTSEGNQFYDVVNGLLYDVEESVEFYAQSGTFSVTTTDMNFDLSQEFEFMAGTMDITSTLTIIEGETVQYTADGLLGVISNSSIDMLGGDISLSSPEGSFSMTALDGISLSSEMRTNVESGTFQSESVNSLVMEVGETNIAGDTFNVMAATDLTLSSLETSITSADSLIESTMSSSINAADIRFVSGPNRHLDVNSADAIDFNTANEHAFYSGSYLHAIAGDNFSVVSEDITLTSEDNASFSSAATLDITAITLATFISAEDLSIQSTGTSNIVLSSGDMHTVTYGRDFHFLAKGLEGDCAITIDSLNGGSTLQSNVGVLSLKAFTEMSLVSETDFSATASGNVFVNSIDSALLFFAEGTTAGITLESTASTREELSNIEFSAVASEVEFFAFDGIELSSTGNSQLLAEEGIHFFALLAETGDTISFASGGASYFTGARGVSFLAGLDAPVVNADFTISSEVLMVESEDAINMLAIGTFSALMEEDINFSIFEGNNINFSSALNYELTSTDSQEFTATDGNISFTANANNLDITTEEEFTLESVNGPVDIIGFAGSILFSGENWELDSEMDTRFTALGAVLMDSLVEDFRVNSNEGECIVLQTHRAGDRISFFGDVITASSTPIDNLDFNDIQVFGNNIDYLATGSATWNTGADLSIGTDSSPIVTMIAGGDAGNPGLLLSSDFDIQIASQSDFLETSLNTLIEVTTGRITSTGEIAFSAGADDMSISTEANIMLDTNIYIGAVVGDYTVNNANDFVMAASLNPNTADPIGVLTVAVGGNVIEDSSESTWTADGLHTLDVVGSVSYTATTDIIVSSNAEPLESERATIDYTMSDFVGTATTSTTFTVTEEESEMIFSTDGVLDISALDILLLASELDSLLKINALDAFTIQTDTFAADIQPVDDGIYREHFAEHPSDIFVTGSEISVTGTTSIDLLSTLDTVIEAGGATNFVFADSFAIDITETGVTSLIEFTAGTDNVFTATDLTITGTELLTDVAEFFYISSDNDVTFNSAAIDLAFDLEILSASESIDFTADTQFDIDFLFCQFKSSGYTSDITQFGSDLSISGAEIEMFAYDTFEMLADVLSITTANLEATATFGDIFIDSPTIVLTVADELAFLATGFQSDKAQAIDIFSEDFQITATESIVIEGQETIQFMAQAHLYTGTGTLDFLSYGFESPVSISALGLFTSDSENTDMNAGSLALFDSNVSFVSTTVAIIFFTDSPRTGILVDTNPIHNSNTQISTISDAIALTSNSIFISSDYTTGAGATIELQSDNVFTNTITNGFSMLAEEGDIAFINTGAISIVSLAGLSLASDTTSLTTDVLTIVSPSLFIESVHGDVLMSRESALSTLITTTVDFNTVRGHGRNTDVVFFSDNNAVLNVVANNVILEGSGGDTGILIEYDFNPASTVDVVAGLDFSTVSKSGISLVGTRHPNPGADGIISFTAANIMDFETLDKHGIIAFQSDTDVVFEALQSIRHTNYAARLGFFSVTPDHIHLTNMQNTEGCLLGGHCGIQNPRSGTNVNAAIQNINNVSLVLLRYLKAFGLVNWKNTV